jgi:hypothetical protein
VSVWPVRVLQATLLVMYFTAGTCKVLWGDWLRDSHVLYSQVQGPYRTEAAAWLLRHLPREAWNLMQSLSLSLELLAPVLFTVRRLRPMGFALGVAACRDCADDERDRIPASRCCVSTCSSWTKSARCTGSASARQVGRSPLEPAPAGRLSPSRAAGTRDSRL